MQFALCEFNNCRWCDLSVRQTMPVWVNPTKYSCLVALMFSPTSRPNPALYPTRKAPRRANIYRNPSVQTAQQHHTFASRARSPARYLDAGMAPIPSGYCLALCLDPIMIQCTLSLRETDCVAWSHAPPELPAKLSELEYFQVISVAVAMFG
jgi:hypothetical protein